jgi:hypothetical protein
LTTQDEHFNSLLGEVAVLPNEMFGLRSTLHVIRLGARRLLRINATRTRTMHCPFSYSLCVTSTSSVSSNSMYGIRFVNNGLVLLILFQLCASRQARLEANTAGRVREMTARSYSSSASLRSPSLLRVGTTRSTKSLTSKMTWFAPSPRSLLLAIGTQRGRYESYTLPLRGEHLPLVQRGQWFGSLSEGSDLVS